MKHKNIGPEELDRAIEFDAPFRVYSDGTVDPMVRDAPMGPRFYIYETGDGTYADDIQGDPWEVETGWTGQYGYNGAIMHPSEYIGGGLARHILSAPGLWVVTEVIDLEDTEALVGWALFHIDETDSTEG